ncbi:hypothetical protein ABBQ38_006403 [Trebouxia sp. C0009 RCD-2024]
MATISSAGIPTPARLRRPAPRQPSRAFIGQSISAQLQNSSFGQFNAYLRDIKAHLPSVDFKLPRVIVVGGKSAGKSSLLEMITKCPIFPRHNGFCTQMPIKLQLKHVSTAAQNTVSLTFQGNSTQLELTKILPEIDKIMQQVEHAVSEPIVVEICKDDVPDFEFVDLPGIQTFPEKQYRRTSELVRTYLSGADTLVLCVVDATAPALDGTLAVKMVWDAGKLSNTILALTKSDLVTTEIGQVENIFDRLLRHSAEMQHLEGLAGCVAVASRDCTDSISLVEADALEQQLLQKMLLDPADAFAPEQVQEQLRQCMGSQQLIFRLDQMFHDYIVQHWKPVALQTLQDVIDNTYFHIHQLGLPVSVLSTRAVLKALQDEVDFDAICCSTNCLLGHYAHRSLFVHQLDHPPMVCPGVEGRWAQWLASVCCSFSEAYKPLSVHNAAIVQAFDDVFEANTTLRLKRFSTLRNLLPRAVLLPRIAESLRAALPATEHMAQTALCSIYSCHPQHMTGRMDAAKRALYAMTNGRQACVQRHLYEALKRHSFELPDDFILTEDQDVETERAALQSTLLKLKTAHDQLSNIEGVFGMVALWHAAAGQMTSVPGVPHSATALMVQTASTESVHSAAVIGADVSGQPVPPVGLVSEGVVHAD